MVDYAATDGSPGSGSNKVSSGGPVVAAKHTNVLFVMAALTDTLLGSTGEDNIHNAYMNTACVYSMSSS